MARLTVGAGPGAPVAVRGYCSGCHEVTEARDGCCSVCGGELIDVTVEGPPSPTATPAAPRPRPVVLPPPVVPEHASQTSQGGRSKGVRIAWVFTVVLLAVGVASFVIANHDDTLNHRNFAADYTALGNRDARTVGNGLDYRVRKVDTAFNAYVAAGTAVRTLHQTIAGKFNEIVTPTDPLLVTEPIKARAQLPGLIAKYGAAVNLERVTRLAYLHQLALLRAQVAR